MSRNLTWHFSKQHLPENADSFGFIPIHGAAFKGHAGVAELLLQHGVEPDAPHRGDGNSPLHRACWAADVSVEGQVGVINALLNTGVDINVPNTKARAAWIWLWILR